jgi:hypothetical protein
MLVDSFPLIDLSISEYEYNLYFDHYLMYELKNNIFIAKIVSWIKTAVNNKGRAVLQ